MASARDVQAYITSRAKNLMGRARGKDDYLLLGALWRGRLNILEQNFEQWMTSSLSSHLSI